MIKKLQSIIKQYWGYDHFRPMQQEAMTAAASQRDSLVVLPTGGGKSLCFQAPAMALDGLAVVVSPLISLMKDQVDSLIECGIPAARVDSSQSSDQNREIIRQVSRGQVKILYISPERLLTDWFIEFLSQRQLSMIAIDEAHCISMWGHDFRPEYRQLDRLKSHFPKVGVHAYTATATQQVRDDIIARLQLADPEVLVGSFHRANLIYKASPRKDINRQVESVIERYRRESGIVYCIRRRDVDEMCAALCRKGFKAAPYHAGLDDRTRRRNQDDFINDRVQIIVATVAFGMGIDKSNVRYVIHAGMPKSLEHYQQESGRAGRDGLESECCLFYGGNDFATWKYFMSEMSPQQAQIAQQKLDQMYQYCVGLTCRHQSLLNYFGQQLQDHDCKECDLCVGDFTPMDDSAVIAQKIISCVWRLEQRYGGDYTAAVLTGSRDRRILEANHDQLSTWGILKSYTKAATRSWIEQLVGQGCLKKVGEYNVLSITETGYQTLKGQFAPRLLMPEEKRARKTRKKKVALAQDSWQGVDQRLFEELRLHRQEISLVRRLPAYLVFGDAVLRDMARRRPSNLVNFLEINGVGEKKRDQYGKEFVERIVKYCRRHKLQMDIDF